MGYGQYSHAAHAALVADRADASSEDVFRQRGVHPLMDPKGLRLRESRDSPDHPNSLAVAFALDVTGSMGEIPELLARRDLPTFMQLLGDSGVVDPQLCFLAVGDATSDRSPLQIGQFESTGELMDQWLTSTHIEGGGGGTGHESYELVFYALAQHTDADCKAKRGVKGYCFLTGDELPYAAVSRHQVEHLFGETLDEDIPIDEAIAAAAEDWHLFFLIPDPVRAKNVEARWHRLLGDHVVVLESADDVCAVAAGIVALGEKALPGLDALVAKWRAAGMAPERVAGAARALERYAALQGGAGRAPAGSGASRPGWWKKLFG